MRNKILRTLSLCMILVLCLNFVSAETVSCQESDGGRNYYVKGSACMGDVCKTDYCSGNTLVEYYIEEEGIIGDNICDPLADVFSVTHECPYGCEDGRCLQAIEEVEEPACTDSDGGKDYYVKGYIINEEGIRSDDECNPGPTTTENDLLEYYCTDNPEEPALGIIYTCHNGCRDGACLVEPEEVAECTDSDGGRDYYEKGTVRWYVPDFNEFWKETDKCRVTPDGDNTYSGDYLIEMTCEGKIGDNPLGTALSAVTYKCPNSCENGACLAEPKESIRCDVKDSLAQRDGRTYIIGDREYDVEAGYVGQGGVKLIINGDVSGGLRKGEVYTSVDGSKIQVLDITPDNKVVFCFDGAVAPIEPVAGGEEEIPETEPITLPADLRYYPKFFIKDGRFNAFIVVGDSAPAMDVISAVDIATGLMEYAEVAHANDVISAVDIATGLMEYAEVPATLLVSEVGKKVSESNNFIIVGNEANKKLGLYDDLEPLNEGEGLIQIIRDRDYVILSVVGYSDLGTRQAARVLANWKDYQLSGNKHIVRITPTEVPTEEEIPEPTCYDGIKNDGETGVDCGGPCKPCPAIGKPCSGCKRNGDCLPFGIRIVEGGVPKYCSITKQFEIQKSADKACQNNYECSTNLCIDNKCISSNLISRILNWFKRFFS